MERNKKNRDFKKDSVFFQFSYGGLKTPPACIPGSIPSITPEDELTANCGCIPGSKP